MFCQQILIKLIIFSILLHSLRYYGIIIVIKYNEFIIIGDGFMKKKTSVKTKLLRSAFRTAMPALTMLCSPPEIDKIKRALFIQPHPDDNQIGAGGTIAKLIDMGVEVYELTVLDDRETDRTYTGNGLTVRQKEALEAQKTLGMKNAGFLGFPDRTRASAREIADKIIPVIREIKPDAVFTVDPNLLSECHEDHIKVGNAVKFAFMDAGFDFCPEYDNGNPRKDTWAVKTIGFYYTDCPNTIIDISDYEDLKFKAIACHVSQKDVTVNAALRLQSQYFAQCTDFDAAEVMRLQGRMHSHCFNLPIE